MHTYRFTPLCTSEERRLDKAVAKYLGRSQGDVIHNLVKAKLPKLISKPPGNELAIQFLKKKIPTIWSPRDATINVGRKIGLGKSHYQRCPNSYY